MGDAKTLEELKQELDVALNLAGQASIELDAAKEKYLDADARAKCAHYRYYSRLEAAAEQYLDREFEVYVRPDGDLVVNVLKPVTQQTYDEVMELVEGMRGKLLNEDTLSELRQGLVSVMEKEIRRRPQTRSLSVPRADIKREEVVDRTIRHLQPCPKCGRGPELGIYEVDDQIRYYCLCRCGFKGSWSKYKDTAYKYWNICVSEISGEDHD